MTPGPLKRPNSKAAMLFYAFVAAVLVNVGVLLLIGSLISQREIELDSQPRAHPIDFVHVRPKPERPLLETRQAKVETAKVAAPVEPSKPAEPEKPTPAPRKPAAIQKPKPAKADKLRKPQTPKPGVAMPRIDVPAFGDGAPMASVPGSDSRLTAPPAQWNPEKQPMASDKAGDGDDVDAQGWSKTPLVVLSRVLPDYPPRAKIQGIQGWVQLEITVSENGAVMDAKVVDAKPPGLFDQAALDAIRYWRFKPAYRQGRPVQRRAVQKIVFRLKH